MCRNHTPHVHSSNIFIAKPSFKNLRGIFLSNKHTFVIFGHLVKKRPSDGLTIEIFDQMYKGGTILAA